ncbi:hypothetical protein QAD02_013991 [Eretmocerus hayati]|uniref:Uncharacterized protein n=1 Tax=Eretmocerus hayati TaxID=131215 RepID=A0ACC2P3M7_9HYME|nr:hypothetical protein QAD02_013991 [Eretmocerus hayati]
MDAGCNSKAHAVGAVPACCICDFSLNIKSTRRITAHSLETLQDASTKRNDNKKNGFHVDMELHVTCLINYPLDRAIKEREKILESAADIISKDFRAQTYDTKIYKPPSEFLRNAEEDVPSSLQTFIDSLIKRNKRLATPEQQEKWRNRISTIAHSIILAVRPRNFISHFLLRVSLMLHRNHCRGKAIATFSNLGLCATYSETMVFENSIANDPECYAIIEEAFSQFAGDNFDDNPDTIDGRNSCHKLGLIECITPGSAVSSSRRIIRCPKLRTEELVKNCGFVP